VAAAEPRAVGYSREVTRTIAARLLPGQDLKRGGFRVKGSSVLVAEYGGDR
jgi:hypothetical protein